MHPLLKRVFITLACLALSQALLYVVWPGLDRTVLPDTYDERFSIVTIGLRSMIAAFLYVELGSFLFKAGRRLRRSGSEGRRRLNMLSIRIGVAFALIQGCGIMLALARQESLNRFLFLWNPGVPTYIFSILTLAAGAITVLMIAVVITRWGVCNGVCLMLLFPYFQSVLNRTYATAVYQERTFESTLEPWVWLGSILVVIWFFANRPPMEFIGNSGKIIRGAAPALPQGESITFSLGILSLISLAQSLLGQTPQLQPWQFDPPYSIWISAVTLVLAGVVMYFLFSSRRRLLNNLPVHAVSETTGSRLKSRNAILVITLVVMSVLYAYGETFLNFRFTPLLGILGLLLTVAFGFDLVGEIHFRIKYGDAVESVIELDNVYGATYLNALLAEAGIDSMIRAFHYRSMFFFFEPMVKMELLVPADSQSRAQQLIQSAALEVV